MNGILIRGYGHTIPFCRFQATSSGPTNVMDLSIDKIEIKKKLYMTSQPVYLRSDPYHYIKYQTIGDCMELGSYSDGGDGDPVFKFVNTLNSELLVSINKNNVEIKKNVYMAYLKKINFNDDNHYIHAYYNYNYSHDGHDGIEIQGWGGGARAGINLRTGGAVKCLTIHSDRVWSHKTLYTPSGTVQSSDDRYKTNEMPIINALSTILKLQPEIYTKTYLSHNIRYIGECPTYVDENGDTQKDYDNWLSEKYTISEEPVIESGFIAQDTYNNVPELRHLVNIEENALNNSNNFNDDGNLIENIVDNNGDPSYLGINYTGIIPYLVGAIKELNTTVQTQATLINNLQNQVNSLLNQ